MGKFSREAALSEMDNQRALLDTLMGINRNLDREEDEISDWRDKRVCKCFLAGLCPHGKFISPHYFTAILPYLISCISTSKLCLSTIILFIYRFVSEYQGGFRSV